MGNKHNNHNMWKSVVSNEEYNIYKHFVIVSLWL